MACGKCLNPPGYADLSYEFDNWNFMQGFEFCSMFVRIISEIKKNKKDKIAF